MRHRVKVQNPFTVAESMISMGGTHAVNSESGVLCDISCGYSNQTLYSDRAEEGMSFDIILSTF